MAMKGWITHEKKAGLQSMQTKQLSIIFNKHSNGDVWFSWES